MQLNAQKQCNSKYFPLKLPVYIDRKVSYETIEIYINGSHYVVEIFKLCR